MAAGAGPLLLERIEATAEPIVLEMLGSPLPESEARTWAALTPIKRENATRRLRALKDWRDAAGSMPVADAAKAAGVGKSRFYRLAADWHRQASLSSLGVLATADRSSAARVSEDANAVLLREVYAVVTEMDGVSVRAQVARLRERTFDALGKKLPKESRLRQYVEQERRRREAKAEVGNFVAFDCAACSLPRTDGRPWVVFALIDRKSGLILAFQLGDTPRSVQAFVSVAADALRRMEAAWSGDVPWAPSCARIDAVVGGNAERGADIEGWHQLKVAADQWASGVNLVLGTEARRHGRYFRKFVGPSIGRIVLSSASTADARIREVEERAAVDAGEALMVLEAEVARHNERVMNDLPSRPDGSTPPPANLVGLLQEVIRWGAAQSGAGQAA